MRVYSETKREWRLLHTPSAVRIRAGMAVRTRPGCVRARARGWVFTPASPTVAYAGQAPHGPSMSTLLEGTLSGHAHLRWGRTAARPPADPPARLLPARRARLQTRAALVQATAYTKRRRMAAGAGPMANPVEICPPDCDRQSASSRQTQQTKERALSESSAGSAAAVSARLRVGSRSPGTKHKFSPRGDFRAEASLESVPCRANALARNSLVQSCTPALADTADLPAILCASLGKRSNPRVHEAHASRVHHAASVADPTRRIVGVRGLTLHEP